LLKQVVDELAPYLTELFNRSLPLVHFPDMYKDAYITPLLKKPNLDAADVKSHRPILYLSVLSKLLKRLVAKQLIDYLKSAKLFPLYQSAYRMNHLRETAVLHALSEILTAVAWGDFSALVLLDILAAFDTVLLKRLDISYSVTGRALKWIQLYLCGRTQQVRLGLTKSSIVHLLCGVPQGSVLGPILFVLYTADLVRLIEQHGLHGHLYADDTQVIGSCQPRDVNALQSRISICLDDVVTWMRSNRLQLNTSKTELLWCATARRQSQLPCTPLHVGPHLVNPTSTVRDLGIYIDTDLSGHTKVLKTTASCFAALWQCVGACRWPPTSHWLCHWCLVGWTTATRRCPACLTTSSVVCSPSSMRRQDRSSISGGRTTLHQPWWNCTGWVQSIESTSRLRRWSSIVSWSCSAVPVIIATSCRRLGL